MSYTDYDYEKEIITVQRLRVGGLIAAIIGGALLFVMSIDFLFNMLKMGMQSNLGLAIIGSLLMIDGLLIFRMSGRGTNYRK
ncbi:MAG: hypothetical protein PHU53_03095 [Thermoplasmata archaeon]|nr:hypothetical protein [Thermoplasmata archaeon]